MAPGGKVSSELWDHVYVLPPKHSNALANGTHKRVWCRYCLGHWLRTHQSPELDTETAMDFGGLALSEPEYYCEGITTRENDQLYQDHFEEIASNYSFFLSALEPSNTDLKQLVGKLGQIYTHFKSEAHCRHIPSETRRDIIRKFGGQYGTPQDGHELLASLSLQQQQPTTTARVSVVRKQGGVRANPSNTARSAWLSDKPHWSDGLQTEFDSDWLRAVVDSGWSWNSAAGEPIVRFMQKWVHAGVKVPSRKVLAGRLLAAEVARIAAGMRERVEHHLAMFQSDGWDSRRGDPWTSFMMSSNRESYLIESIDMSGRPKTGDQLLLISTEAKRAAVEKFGVVDIGHCTDDGPDGKKMRRVAAALLPHQIFSFCWAHQTECIVRDVIKASPSHRELIQQAKDIAKYVRNHDRPRAALRRATYEEFGQEYNLITPSSTRWAGWHTSFARFKKVQTTLQVAVLRERDEWVEHIPQKMDPAVLEAMLDRIEDNDIFWPAIKGLKDVLCPLAIANRVLQAPFTRGDHVLTTLAILVRVYTNPSSDWAEHGLSILTAAAVVSAEKRFRNTDQDVLIFATVVNPKFRFDIFNGGGELTPQKVLTIADRLCRRFYNDISPDDLFRDTLQSYLRREDEWADMHPKRTDPDNLVYVWEQHLHNIEEPDHTNGHDRFVMLAIRILHAILNSANLERQFSGFGITQSKLRNSSGVGSIRDQAIVKGDCIRERANREDHSGVYETEHSARTAPTQASTSPTEETHRCESDGEEDGEEDDTELEMSVHEIFFGDHAKESLDEEPTEQELDEHWADLKLPGRRPAMKRPEKYTIGGLFDLQNPRTLELLQTYWVPHAAAVARSTAESKPHVLA